MNCLFCNIINNSVDSLTLYEDDIVKVILDAFPNKPGHTLIIPKRHFIDLDDIPLDVLTHIFKIAKDIKPRLEKCLNPKSIILVQNNGYAEKIKHFHLHLIPDYDNNPDLTKEDIFKLVSENS